MFAIGQSNFLQALGWAVLNSLWQMALLWVVYQLIISSFKNTNSYKKSLLATTMLFTGFAWFLLTLLITLSDAAAVQQSYHAFVTVTGNEAVNSGLQKFLPFASLVYLLLLIAPILNFIRNYRYVQVIRSQGLRKANVEWRIFVQNMAAHMGIKKPVHVWLSELVNSPVTIGYFKPIILLPVAAVNHLSPQQVEAVLLHELSHIRRFDFLINLISKAIQSLLYFNPFVKAFARIIESEREKNCDELVLQFQYEPHGYASALLTLEKAAHPIQTLAVAASMGSKKDLLSRIESILGIRKQQTFSFQRLAGIAAALLCFVGINALLLLSKPGESNLRPGLLTDLSVPFHLFSPTGDQRMVRGNEKPEADDEILVETEIETITNNPGSTEPVADLPKADLAKQSAKHDDPDEVSLPTPPAPPAPAPAWTYNYVTAAEKIIPDLEPEQEKQVQEALKASQKVMAEDHWKLMEKNIADAMTAVEKEKLKAEYNAQMSKMDWEKLEDQLKLTYEKINWNQVNSQLNSAMAEIKLDSLQKVYSLAVAELANLEKELKENKQPGIPDTDITLKTLAEQRHQAQKVINTIKAARSRKIVHL